MHKNKTFKVKVHLRPAAIKFVHHEHISHYCYLVCSPPPIVPLDAVSNPEFNFSSVFAIGDAITYSCTNPAFTIANNAAICQPDGTWIPSSFVCNQIGNYTAVHEHVSVYAQYFVYVIYTVCSWTFLKLEI